jgi:hypothetical protein
MNDLDAVYRLKSYLDYPAPMASVPNSNDENASDTRGQRSTNRSSLFLLGKMGVDGGVSSEAIRIRNLSPTGLMAEAPTILAVGTAVVVEMKNLPLTKGKVVWATDGRMGIAFNAEIDPAKVRQPVGKGEDPTPDFLKVVPTRRPGLKMS